MARKSKPKHPNHKPGTTSIYAKIGTEYYIAARVANERDHLLIAGNLVHNGFEMLLKFTLLGKNAYTPDELQQQFGHNLPALWEAAKVAVGPWAAAQDWDRFDDFIHQIHRFEDIRYGEFPLGLAKNVRVVKLTGLSAVPPLPGHDQYLIDLEKTDDL